MKKSVTASLGMKKSVTASLNYTYLWYVRIDSTDKATDGQTDRQTDKLVCIIIRDCSACNRSWVGSRGMLAELLKLEDLARLLCCTARETKMSHSESDVTLLSPLLTHSFFFAFATLPNTAQLQLLYYHAKRTLLCSDHFCELPT